MGLLYCIWFCKIKSVKKTSEKQLPQAAGLEFMERGCGRPLVNCNGDSKIREITWQLNIQKRESCEGRKKLAYEGNCMFYGVELKNWRYPSLLGSRLLNYDWAPDIGQWTTWCEFTSLDNLYNCFCILILLFGIK